MPDGAGNGDQREDCQEGDPRDHAVWSHCRAPYRNALDLSLRHSRTACQPPVRLALVATRTIETPEPLDLRANLWPHLRGYRDPTMRIGRDGIWRATRTPDGPATVRVTASGRAVRVEGWGAGVDWALEEAAALVGARDDPGPLRPAHRVVADAVRRLPGVRLGRTSRVWEALLPAVLEQKVTGDEARRAFRGLVRRYGERAPGPQPAEGALFVVPPPEVLGGLPYHAYHPFGV